MKELIGRIPSIFKNFYFLATLFFVVWLAFVDSNDLFLQARLSTKKAELEEARQFYQDRILQVKNEQEALNNNPALLEKIAREKYLMKRPGEDIYVIVEED